MSEAKEVFTNAEGEEIDAEDVDTASEDEGISDLESSIILQVEYYFGDLNMRRDEFMHKTLKMHDGWLPLNILTRFNMLAKLSKDTTIIAKALRKSRGFLEVSEDNKKVRRRPEAPVPKLTPELKRELTNRTIYAKGYHPNKTTLDDLIMYYKNYDVEKIMMRKFQRPPLYRVFKGSVYITFKTREQAVKFMAERPHEYQGRPLKVLWQNDYLDLKYMDYDYDAGLICQHLTV